MFRISWVLATVAACGFSVACRGEPARSAGTAPGRDAAAGTQPTRGDVKFFGLKIRNAAKVVFVLDHTGSMIDTFDFLRDGVKSAVRGLAPEQQFAVVMFSQQVDDVFPKGGASLVPANAERVKSLEKFIDQVRAPGKSDETIDTYAKAMEKAFSFQPDAIVFVTDGQLDPALGLKVAKLNAGKKVRVYTIAFMHAPGEGERILRDMAKDNGGEFRFVKEVDLAK